MRVVPGLKAGLALSDACDLVARAFRERGIESPQADARILAAHALALTRAQLIAQADRELEPREIDAISARAARRLEREPVSRIVGTREFWGLTLEIDPAVLDPRPDTETVIEMALDWITTRGLRREKLRVLDIGTGSGALLLALLSELPEAFGVGTDISVEALLTARRNAVRTGLAPRCVFVACDISSALHAPFDLIVANPPYIRSGDIDTLPPEVRDFDPRPALDGGDDGLAAYRVIATDGRRLLAERGRLVVELGQGQAGVVQGLFQNAGLSVETAPRRDLSGVSRALCATTP
jgi:release factor glutamine methyltransferase